MDRNTMLLIVIGSFSSLCCAMQNNGQFSNLSQPRTPFQQNPMQQTNVNIANLHQMHGTPVPQHVLNGLTGIDATVANRYNAGLASQQKK